MKNFSLLILLSVFIQLAKANNIIVSNVAKSSVNATQDYAIISFDISWENSWRDADNYDAAWVFIKFRVQGSTAAWSHASIHNDGHTAPAGSVIDAPADGKGVFIYRAASGSGNVSFANVQLRWDYGLDGMADNAPVDISVSAIEMVYVPQGSFQLGDGSIANLNGQFENGISGNPLTINSENALTLGGGAAGSVGNNNRTGMANNGLSSIPGVSIDDFDDVTSQTLPAAFPKGFNAFYCMKYEITQAQYVDFLNKISATQFAARYDPFLYTGANGGFTATRYNITGTHPNMVTITPELPAVFVEWYDAAAYADWSGLRPMTEMEFEKACRGPLAAVTGEYAWGSTAIHAASYFPIGNMGQTNESIGNNFSAVAGNSWYGDTRAFDAITRVGIFSANPNNVGRITAGATYWGIMEMSGHCWERCVSVGRPEGRTFQGTHGDGNLTADGNADNSDWPGFVPGIGVNTAIGCGYRGGAFSFPNPTQPNLRISGRIVATAFYNIRYYDDAARFVRSADNIALSGPIANGKYSGGNGDGFATSQGAVILPVKLVSFEASLQNNQAQISWTATATNVSKFILEISHDGNLFQYLTEKAVSENTRYGYADIYRTGIWYYRLKWQEADGSVHYSKVIALNFPANLIVQVSYNGNHVQIDKPAEFSLVELYSADGRLQKKLLNNSTRARLVVGDLPTGVYFLRLSGKNPGQLYTTRFVKPGD